MPALHQHQMKLIRDTNDVISFGGMGEDWGQKSVTGAGTDNQGVKIKNNFFFNVNCFSGVVVGGEKRLF